MITTNYMDLGKTFVWEGASGKVAPKGLTGLEAAMDAEIVAGNIVATPIAELPAGKAGVFEGTGFRLEIMAKGKSPLYRSFVCTNPANFEKATGVSLWTIEGVLVNQEQPVAA